MSCSGTQKEVERLAKMDAAYIRGYILNSLSQQKLSRGYWFTKNDIHGGSRTRNLPSILAVLMYNCPLNWHPQFRVQEVKSHIFSVSNIFR